MNVNRSNGDVYLDQLVKPKLNFVHSAQENEVRVRVAGILMLRTMILFF